MQSTSTKPAQKPKAPKESKAKTKAAAKEETKKSKVIKKVEKGKSPLSFFAFLSSPSTPLSRLPQSQCGCCIRGLIFSKETQTLKSSTVSEA